jgi:O-antigen/teichoic acid export membrane protein
MLHEARGDLAFNQKKTNRMIEGSDSEQDGRDHPADRYLNTDHLQSQLSRRAARGGAVTVAAQIYKFAVSTVGAVVLARLLSPQDYGLVGMVAIVINFVTMFQYLGLSTATVKWAKLTHRAVSSLFWINLALSVAVTLVTVASAPLLTWFYKDPRLTGITIAYAVTITLSGLGIQHEALLTRQMRFAVIALIEVTAISSGLLAAIVAAWYGAGYWALVLNTFVMLFVTVVGVWAACRWRPGLPRRNSGVRTMLAYGGNLTGFNIMTFFSRNLDNALIGKFWGPYQLGLYAKAYQLLLLPMQQINAPFAAVAIPALSRLADSPERYRSAYLKILEKIAIITMPGVAFMIGTSDWLVLFLLGPQWHETGRIFMLLGIAAFVQPITKTSWWLFSTQGRTRDLFHWGLIGGAIAVLSILVGLRWGAIGVAAAYAISDLCLATPILFWYVGRKGPIRAGDFYRTVAPSLSASLCALTVLYLCRSRLELFQSLFIRLLLGCGITAAVSLLVLWVIPAGRRAIQDFAEMLLLLIKRTNQSSGDVAAK